MVATDQAGEIFADAYALHASALERLDAGDIRDAPGGYTVGVGRRGEAEPPRPVTSVGPQM